MTSRRWTELEAPRRIDLRLALPALATWAGCLIGLWIEPGAGRPAAAAATAVLCAATALVLVRVRSRRATPFADTSLPDGPGTSAPGGAGSAVVWVMAACAAAGMAAASGAAAQAHADPLMAAARDGDWVTVTATATGDAVAVPDRFPSAERSPPDPAGARAGSWRIEATARRAVIEGVTRESAVHVTVFARGAGWADIAAGQRVSFGGTASVDSFGAIDAVTVRASGAPTVRAGPPWWAGWAARVRAGLRTSATAMPTDRGALLRGLVLGDTSGISDSLDADAKTTGLTHLVAVSGAHMAMVGGLVLIVLRRAGPRIAAIGAAGALGGMVILVGPDASVLRAVVMGLIGLAAAVLGRERAALSSLAAAVLILLLVDPALAADTGFALSVQATAALVLLAPPWIRALGARGVPRGWAQLLVLPVAAHLATVPVIASLSGSVSLVAVPANIAVTPVVLPAMLVGLACAVVSPWWPAAGAALAHLDGPLLGWIIGVAHRLARWPAATVPWPATPTGVLVLALLLVGALLTLRHRRIRALTVAAALGAAAVLLPAAATDVGWPAAGWLLTGCDVGQGDGMVLSTGEPGVAVVVDTGPDPAAMDRCLDRLGVTTIAMLVITHLHADHVGGLAGALDGRIVREIGVGPDRSSPSGWRAIREAAADRGVPLIMLRPGGRLRRGTLSLTVLAPSHAFHGTDSDPNNDSVVLMAVDRGIRILMTGDIERRAQTELLDSGVDLRADVLKQPHHGSAALLPEFVAAVSPTVAVIGVGADNDYGHPSARALRLDRAAGVRTVLRTDRDGDVQVCLTADGLGTVARRRTLLAR